jgi:GT2 family glycosyltransferase
MMTAHSPNGLVIERPAPVRTTSAFPGPVQVDGKQFARGTSRVRIQGVTYGPFPPGPGGHPFPAPERVADDFARMAEVGVNAVRTYHVPPEWFFHLADEAGVAVLIDVPWPKHLCFLDSARARADARSALGRAAKVARDHPSVLALSIGNEIPTDVARWHGPRRVERFLAELADLVRQAYPGRLVTYANFPPAEYHDLSCLDFATFNVYLHDREAFRRYLFRLQNLVGDKPLVLGELGMDTLRHGEAEQAEFLAGHLAEARLMGLAGAFVFSWTDEWHTGGHPITDWAFGVTRADRSPKASYHALRELFTRPPSALLDETPRVSVVVCTYNGGRTLDQCLRSLENLDYPDYEVIVVDDGSTDDTQEILSGFRGAGFGMRNEDGGPISIPHPAFRVPQLRVIRQPNMGLSVARNVGLHAATGEVVAYTDSDCFADPDWLTHLVYQLHRSGAAGVGGPNLTPEDGQLAACVAGSPGQPTHVLVSDQVAEHIPGCNMAFRKDALLAVNGFDPLYRKAGDDVDVCWRLQQAGMWITFAPGAFVWHHRRQGPRSYLRQQAGYGEAEALLFFKHPDQFNARGESKWRGQMYGGSAPGVRVGRPVIYHGTFATGLFQSVYQPGPAHWVTLPATLEWHAAAAAVGLAGLLWWPLWVLAGAMLVLSLAVAGVLAAQAKLPREHDGLRARLAVAALSYAQPLVRSWRRYKTWLFAFPVPEGQPDPVDGPAEPLPLAGRRTVEYWAEEWRDRTELLNQVAACLAKRRWGRAIDSGWSDWDLEVSGDRYTAVQVRTVQEEHGGGKRLIRVSYRVRPRGTLWLLAGLGVALTAAVAVVNPALAAAPALTALASVACVWWRGLRTAGAVARVFDTAAAGLKLTRCNPRLPPEPAATP